MGKFSNFLKTKVLTKTVGMGVVAVAAVGAIAGSFAFKYSHRFKPTFYNYKSYMSHDNIAAITEKYDFKEFDTLNEFTKAILTNKAVAGIGSDSQAVQLIRRNKLQKIDFEHLLGINVGVPKDDATYTQKLGEILKKDFYTKTVWDHLTSYDNMLKTDYEGNVFETPRHLWEYFVPYFAQDMVVAYNPDKIKIPGKEKEQLNVHQKDQLILQHLYENYYKNEEEKDIKLIEVLKTLNHNGVQTWEITDAVRDNMIYGSSYRFDTDAKVYRDDQATGSAFYEKTDFPIYEDLIDQFRNLFKDGTGKSLTDPNVSFIGSGLQLLENVINPHSPIQAGLIYNGDAFDAYHSEDNFPEVPQGTLRFLRAKINILLVDGFILTKDLSDDDAMEALNIVKNSIFRGAEVKDWSNLSSEEIESFGLYENFDYVGYTPVFQSVYNYIANSNYLGEPTEDKTKKYELEYLKNLYKIDSETTISDYEGKYQMKYNVKHYAIEPVDQKVETKINTKWTFTIKK